MNLTPKYVSEALHFAGVTIKRGGMRTIAFPKLREVAVGEYLDLASVGGRSGTIHALLHNGEKSRHQGLGEYDRRR